MASETSELLAVAVGAAGFVEAFILAIVAVYEIAAMRGGFEGRDVVVALFARKGRVHLRMADKAVGHVGENAESSHVVRLFDPVVATGTGVCCVEMGRSAGVEILFAGDGGAEDGRDVAELGVELVVESIHLPFGGRFG